MSKSRVLLFAVLSLVPAMAFAAGGGLLTTTTASQAQTSTVTVIVPAVIGVDVESDIFFDFANTGGYTFNQAYAAPAAATTAACAANQWPPANGCSGAARYDPSVNVTGGVPAGSANHLWLAIFSSKSGATGTMDLKTKISAFGTNPGFASTNVRYQTGTSNNAAVNGATFGAAAATNFTLADTTVKIGALATSTYPWSRIDQKIDLSIPSASTVAFNNGTHTATITYTLSY